MSWVLAVDFGTSFSAAAVGWDGRVELVRVEKPGGEVQPRLPSCVFAPAGSDELVVGWKAENRARRRGAVALLARAPKQRLGEPVWSLGERDVPVVRLVGAVVAELVLAGCELRGGEPSEVRLTHPASWQRLKLGALCQAAREAAELVAGRWPGAAAGLREPVLVAEPVAAAVHFAGARLSVGELVAVYDLGGGTFDAAVLRRTAGPEQFEVVGKPLGRDGLGGEEFDRLLEGFVGERLRAVAPEEWAQVAGSPVAALELREEVRTAKEALSRHTEWDLQVPVSERSLRLTREELEGLIGEQVALSVERLAETIEGARRLSGEEVSSIYLAGGSSRIPLVHRLISERFQLPPAVLDDPKSVVATGAAAASVGATRVADGAERLPSVMPVTTDAWAPPDERALVVTGSAAVAAPSPPPPTTPVPVAPPPASPPVQQSLPRPPAVKPTAGADGQRILGTALGIIIGAAFSFVFFGFVAPLVPFHIDGIVGQDWRPTHNEFGLQTGTAFHFGFSLASAAVGVPFGFIMRLFSGD